MCLEEEEEEDEGTHKSFTGSQNIWQFVSSHRDFHILFLHQSPCFSTQLGPGYSTYQSENHLYNHII